MPSMVGSRSDSARAALDQATEDLHLAEEDKAKAELELARAEAGLKEATKELDRLDKLAQQKRWKSTDWLLAQRARSTYSHSSRTSGSVVQPPRL